MREVSIFLNDILSLVHCAEDYGHNNDVLLVTLWQFTGEQVSDADILEYANSLDNESGYDQEDRDDAVEVVTKWRDHYAEVTKRHKERFKNVH